MVDLGTGGPPEDIPSPVQLALTYGDVEGGELVGQGGNADVYRVEVLYDGEPAPVAVKQPRFQGTLHGDVMERFREEAEVWGSIDDHDHVVGLYDWGEQPLPWLAMEYMDGGTLEELLADGRLPTDQAAWVALCICRAVRYAHRHGVAHNDLKPSNVLFTTSPDGWMIPKVSDWGLARMMLDETGSVEGLSPQYAAPEQFAPDDYGSPDDLTDVYQLGVVAYELFTGAPPFEGPAPSVMNGVLNERPEPPSAVADVPPAVDDAILPALERDREERYESVLYLRDALSEVWEDARTDAPDAADGPAPSGPTTGAAPNDTGGEDEPAAGGEEDEIESTSVGVDAGADDGPSGDGDESGLAGPSDGDGPGGDGDQGVADAREPAGGTGARADVPDRPSGATSEDDGRNSRRTVLKAGVGVAGLGLAGAATWAVSNSAGGTRRSDGGGGGGGNGTGGGGTGGGGSGGSGGGSGGPSGTVKVGVLQPLSESVKYYGTHAYQGFLSGLAYKDGSVPPATVETGQTTVTVGDVDYELYVRDTRFLADRALSLATDLVQNEEVDLLFGCASSSAAQRIVDTVVKATDVPLLAGPTAATSLTASSEFCHPRVFRASETTAMDARTGGTYIANNTDISRVYLFGADYSFGHELVDTYRTVLERNGVEIVGETFVQRGREDWAPLLQEAEDAGAEGVVAGFTVATLPALFTSYLGGDYSFRVFGGFATKVTNNVIGDVLENSLGSPLTAEKLDRAGLGPFTTRYHWNQYDNEVNEAFVSDHVEVYGTVPDLFSAGTFTAASALHQAVTASDSTAPDDLVDALRGVTVEDTPKGQGAYLFQPYNNQARSPMTVAPLAVTSDRWADAWNAPVMPGAPVARVGMDETTIPADSGDMDCSL